MDSVSQLLDKPEYFWRPIQILHRLCFKPSNDIALFRLAWGGSIYACSSDEIGRSIATLGVYDLALTEALIRLSSPGETAIDVGANIGYTSLALAKAVGPGGRVIAYEPHPQALSLLRRNVAKEITPIEIIPVALSDRDGTGVLGQPDERNRGFAGLGLPGCGTTVLVRRLDGFESADARIMKIDVEGHEAAVFAGARGLLGSQQVRDIIFEENASYPAPSHQSLEEFGYRIFRISRTLSRPILLPAHAPMWPPYLPANWLATLDAERANQRFARSGWRALSSR
jgi:FkbM family methyltransferase